MNNFLWTHLSTITILSTLLKGSHGIQGIFEKIGDKLYYIETEKLTWFEAYQRCRSMKGDLIYIENDWERESLVNYLAEKFSHTVFWTGVNNLEEEEFYSTKTNAPITFSFWMHNRPKPRKSCVVLKKQNSNFYMRAVSCDEFYGFICDLVAPKKLISDEVNVLKVPVDLIPSSKADQFIKIGPRYYFIWTKKSNFFAADFTCRGMNAYLADIENSTERTYLVEFYLNKYHNESFWIGARSFGDSDFYNWMKTSNVVKLPSPKVETEKAAIQLKKKDNEYHLEKTDAAVLNAFICESRLPPHLNALNSILLTVPAESYNRTGSNYKWIENKMYYISTETATWYRAQQRCREMNLYLFAWENEAQFRAMGDYLSNNDRDRFWTGINKLADPNRWTWEKGLSTNFFTYWYLVGGRICAPIWWEDGMYLRITDYICHNKLRFICQE